MCALASINSPVNADEVSVEQKRLQSMPYLLANVTLQIISCCRLVDSWKQNSLTNMLLRLVNSFEKCLIILTMFSVVQKVGAREILGNYEPKACLYY